MTVELTFDSTCTEPFPAEQRHDRLARKQDSRSPCYVAGSRSHRRCSERAIVKTGPHQVFWNHSHCTPDNTENIKQDLMYCWSQVNAVLGWGDIICLKQTCPALLHQLMCITLLILHIFNYNYKPLLQQEGTAVARWLRHCATNRKVAGLITGGVIGISH